MKKTGLLLCGLCLGLSNLSAQVAQNAVPPMAGWNYYGGDELMETRLTNPDGVSMVIQSIIIRLMITVIQKSKEVFSIIVPIWLR